ncbi:MAG: secretin N-terminal domain-containing protein [Planctomycetota bacterium]
MILLAFVVALIASMITGAPVRAQETSGSETVKLNLSGTVKVTALLDLMSRQLGVRYLHGTDIAKREVTVYTPAELPKRVLPTLLGNLLREANLAIVDTDVPGWKRVVDLADIVSAAPTGNADEVTRRNGPAGAVTEVLPVKFISVTTASTALKPFLTKTGSNVVAIADQNLLIVTGYSADVRLVAELLALIDRADADGVIEFYESRRRPPSVLIEQYNAIYQPTQGKQPAQSSGPKLLVDEAGSRVVVAGRRESVETTLLMLKRLDSGNDYLTRIYRPEFFSVEKLGKLIEGFVADPVAQDSDDAPVEITTDEESNLLVVRAGSEVHQQIETLLKELDQPVDSDESPIRFYKLKNATAIEVLYSLLALQEAAGSGGFGGGGLAQGSFGTLGGANASGVVPTGMQGAVPGMQGNVMGAGGINPNAAGGAAFGGGSFGLAGQNLSNNLSSSRNPNQNAALGNLAGGGLGGGFGGALGGVGGAGGSVATLPGGARVSADVATNSLIVFAPSNVQSLYERLIRSLDQRRPQVLIQAHIIAIDTTDNFSLGVEISGGDRSGAKRLFKFTSFGLSEVDPVSGALSIDPSLGFNGVLVDPDVADVIVQALSRHTRGRVLSSPKVLVNDNQTGLLNSISSIPFQAFSQGETSTLAGLGGNQEAGTTIQVTPHINEDDHLQLEFDVEFSTFVGVASDNLPPPRQIDRVGSVVTIPDGKTVVVGGLKRTSDSDAFTGVPFLERIPVLRELSSLQSNEQSTTSFFLFIQPRILRDSQFRDLKFLSDLESQDAQLSTDYPASRPMLIHCDTQAGGKPRIPSRTMMRRNASDVPPEMTLGPEVYGEPVLIHP